MRRKKSPQIQIKKYIEDLPGFEKPYLHYHRGKGMPSAREPIECLDLTHPKAYKGWGERTYNRKNPVVCKDECQFRSERRNNGCSAHFDVSKCDKKKFKNMKIVLAPVRIAPQLKGLGMYDK